MKVGWVCIGLVTADGPREYLVIGFSIDNGNTGGNIGILPRSGLFSPLLVSA